MKKILFGLFFALLLAQPAQALSAHSAIVLDCASGDVLFAHNADEILPMASTTKIMTALVALDYGDLDRTYTVKKAYTLVEGSSMYLREGETISMRDTLYGLMLMSGNDAALAVAGECGGQQAFVQAMNDKAAALGLTNTHFDNPNGLDSENHHTTAHELATLAAYAMQNPDFRQIVSTASYTMEGRTMVNHNKLLKRYPDAIGIKTGYTKKSGRCLVSAAERNGRQLVAVTLNDPDDWDDHIAMLDDAFSQFQEYTLHEAGQQIGSAPCEGGDITDLPYQTEHDIKISLTPAEYEALETSITGAKFIYAPAAKGQTYGTITYMLHGKPLAQDQLIFTKSTAMLPEKLEWWEILLQKIASLLDDLRGIL